MASNRPSSNHTGRHCGVRYNVMAVPTQTMQDDAQRALDVRQTLPPSRRAGTAVGIARARDIARGADLSRNTLLRMHSYLSRTDSEYKRAVANDLDITTSKQILATYLWGGPTALAWARRELNI